jgi:hypothetical protein
LYPTKILFNITLDKIAYMQNCGSKAWTIREQDEWQLTTAGATIFRNTAGYSRLDYKRNELITEEHKTTPRAEY